MLNSRSGSRSPFTAAQWQELEHQALIYKYMVSGVPVPPELLYSVKRSLESSLASSFFPHQPIGWGCFQVGFGRKADPEPGRCRRTDGKKWRCSKEAYPDSKYCEKHMHRGRNRSRKPVEQIGSTPTNTNISSPSLISSTSSTTSPTTSSYSFSPLSSKSLETDQNPGTLLNPFLHTHPSASRPIGSSFSSQTSTTHNLFLDSSGSSSRAENECRYYHGIRDVIDERAFFPEASGSVRRLQEPYQHLTMSPYKDYSQSQFQSFADASKQPEEQNHCLVLGTDFKSQTSRPIKLEKDADNHKPVHHFFDQWPPKNSTDSWLDLASTTSSTIHSDG